MELLRPAIALWILWLLVRVARVSWRQRDLSVTVWRAIRVRHLFGAAGLLVVVGTAAGVLVAWLPGADLGLGHLVGLTGNAVFAPLEEGLARAGPPPASGPDWLLLVGVSLFLGPIVLLLPWLAFVEEEVFRAGLEAASRGAVARASLGFGLVHLVMLVPLGAALAIGIAGAAYAAVYRRAYAAGALPGAPQPPLAVLRAYRPSRRARAAAARTRAVRATAGPAGSGQDPADRIRAWAAVERRQATAVFEAAVWHTTFNTLVVLLVWVGFVLAAL